MERFSSAVKLGSQTGRWLARRESNWHRFHMANIMRKNMNEEPMPESAVRQLLGPLKERIKALDDLLNCLIHKLEIVPQNEIIYEQLEEYRILAAERVCAVLAYRNIAVHWPSYLKKQIQLETVLDSYEHLTELLGQQSVRLEQMRQNMKNSLQNKGRNQCEPPGRLLDFEC